jgi:ribosomal protein S27E
MKIKCPKCKKEWNYGGKSKYYVSCPQCHKNINIEGKKNLIEEIIK